MVKCKLYNLGNWTAESAEDKYLTAKTYLPINRKNM